MASQSQGIQALLQAEKRAAEKVAEARKRKARRLKQAKEEAQAEIEKYRTESEAQFKEHEAKHMGTRTDIAAKIDADTKTKILAMNDSVAKHRDEVMDSLMKHIANVEPKVHENYANSLKK